VTDGQCPEVNFQNPGEGGDAYWEKVRAVKVMLRDTESWRGDRNSRDKETG